jgi:hypothetical protein
MIKKGDIVSVNFNNTQYALCGRAKVLQTPSNPGESWVFANLVSGEIHYVSEGCTITKGINQTPDSELGTTGGRNG